MRKLILILTMVVLVLTLSFNQASATSIWFEPDDQLYWFDDTLNYDLYADIDELDAIFGFGFDLSFDDGATYISGPGDSGTYLTFTEFIPNSTYFQYDLLLPPLWDDGDTIAGEVLFNIDDVWGTDILLGTFYFTAPGTGPIGTETLYLGPLAGDYGMFGEEGLIGLTALMPNNPGALANPVPEPSTMLLLGCGLFGLAGLRKKFSKR